MTKPVFLGQGKVYPKLGLVTGQNRNGDTISGHRTAPGQWELTNQNNGTQFDVDVKSVGPYKHKAHLEITRTDAQGNITQNDLTLLRGAGRGFGVYDFNQSGFQAMA